jgi:hypothetical protein
MMDTHEAVKQLRGAGFDEAQAEALVRVVGTGQDALATNADLETQTLMIRSDLQALEQSTKAALQAQAGNVALESFARTTAANLEIFEWSLRDHLTLRLGAMLFAATGMQVVIIVFLLTQFFSN